jgi:hypothetical protein
MREIDRGSFGKIFKSTYEGRTVAVKQLANHGPSTLKAKMRELLLELRVLVRIEHPNIVKFYGTATDFNKSQAQNKQPYVGELFQAMFLPRPLCKAHGYPYIYRCPRFTWAYVVVLHDVP